jgi:hypothetical protein
MLTAICIGHMLLLRCPRRLALALASMHIVPGRWGILIPPCNIPKLVFVLTSIHKIDKHRNSSLYIYTLQSRIAQYTMDALDALSLCLSHLGTHLDVMEGVDCLTPRPQSPKCAFVVLVMKGDYYVPGALVTAHSLKKSRTQHDVVCMVTDDVSANARQTLKLVFDKVVDIDYITAPCKPLHGDYQQTTYGKWIGQGMTALRCLWLYEYPKVCLLDADITIIRNMDSVFDLPAPAGSFTNNFHRSHFMYPQHMKHGDTVPSECIMESLNTPGAFVCIFNCLLLAPGVETSREFLKYIDHYSSHGRSLGFKCKSVPQEQVVSHFFAHWMGQTWSDISLQYQYIPWKHKPKRGPPYLLHYFDIKPWAMHVDAFPDLQVWWASAREICAKHPDAIHCFPPDSVHNMQLVTKDTGRVSCFFCGKNHNFIDFYRNIIRCPEITEVTEH